MRPKPTPAATALPHTGHDTQIEPQRAIVARIAAAFAFASPEDYHVTTPALLQRAFCAACAVIREDEELANEILTDYRSPWRQALEQELHRHARSHAEDRVPGMAAPEAELVARHSANLVLGMLGAYCLQGGDRSRDEQEMTFMMSAYMYARFPPVNDFTWHLPDRAIRPARPSRRDFRYATTVFPAYAAEATT